MSTRVKRRHLPGLLLLGLLTLGPLPALTCPTATAGPTWPLEDDLQLMGLVEAAENSRQIMARRDGTSVFELCGQSYTLDQLRQGLENFTAAARQAADAAELTAHVRENFRLCRSGGEERSGLAFLTGYYAPEVAGSLEPGPEFPYPLYSPPPDLTRIDGREGRLVEGRLQPYWSRAQIENGNLLAGHELVYLADPLDAFVLHVQGSGWVRFPDGTRRPLLYAAKSGREYRSIGRLLVSEGRLSREEADLPGILRYLRAHPEQLRRVLHHNESYIFFRWGKEDAPGPLGSFGLPLTAGRSLAMDQTHYPPGVPAYLAGTKPLAEPDGTISGWQPFGRFVFNQDSGSAIVGRGRIDLFWGGDRSAEIAAGVTRHPAELFLLLPKTSGKK
ncbi:MAG TPA: transglycosylase [Desulfurivibrio alkaliphilus]|mgnify:CR=1 FL=1|uniref:peptidoglycan lytic exotransglycosylase n=1 Tax=Desulfurivibrio alkaliphilus TaxID=427923 RepID=A0A7C2TGW4_9BACT|nr:transglycosylase [Desulfurivibrio alkaliphilus]